MTCLTPLTLAVASGTTSDEYIDISDLAVFRITCTPSDGCANVIEGYAITGVYADLNDPGLRGQWRDRALELAGRARHHRPTGRDVT